LNQQAWDYIKESAIKAQEGDRMAYQLFLKGIQEKIIPLIRKNLKASLQDDCLQESLMGVHRSFHTLNTKKNIKSWVNSIVYYKIKDQLRSFYKNNNNRDAFFEDSLPSEINNLHDNNALEGFLKKLNKKEEKILRMCKIEGYKISEVAKKTQLSESNIKLICFRAIKKLQAIALQEDFL